MASSEQNGLKKLILALGLTSITAIVTNSGLFLYYAGKMEVRVDHAERDIVRHDGRITHLERKEHDR